MSHSPQSAILLFGGPSAERLVSVASAQNILASSRVPLEAWFIDRQLRAHRPEAAAVLAHADPFTVEFAPVGAGLPWAEALALWRGRRAYIALHGTWGEDGGLQSDLDRHGVAYTGADAAACRLAFDKTAAKAALAAAGHRVPVAVELDPEGGWGQLPGLFAAHGAFALKPVRNGSSIGLHLVRDAAAAAAVKPEGPVGDYIAEELIAGREFTVGVWDSPEGPAALPVSEVRVDRSDSFDYSGKYLGRGSTELTPAPIDAGLAARLGAIALDAHRLCGCRGYSRTDILLDARGPAFLEINTHPGMSRASFIPQQLRAAGVDFGFFLEWQLNLAAGVSADRSPLRR